MALRFQLFYGKAVTSEDQEDQTESSDSLSPEVVMPTAPATELEAWGEEGLDAERERLALFWSFPCFTLAPGGTVEEAEATAEDEEEVEAAEEESVMVLHPALAEVADFEASL
ncbi:hypothetical protein U0070_012208, partial [Myodes glareolus]